MTGEHKKILHDLGVNIRDARIKTGISLLTMANLSGVSKGNCSKIEHGGNVTTLCLYKLCWAIGVHPREVLPEYRTPKNSGRPESPVHSIDLVRLLEDCDTAMTTVGQLLWNHQRELALQLSKLAARCRIEILDRKANKKAEL